MSQGPSSLTRAGLLLFSVAVVGALIGFGWEEHAHQEDEARFEAMMAEGSKEGLPSPKRYSGPSPEERAIIRRATAGMPPYKDAVPQALAADFLDPGSPIAAAWFMTKDTPDQVLGHYEGALLDAGLPIVHHRYNVNAGYVGYMVPSTKEMHTVSVLAQGGETAVFVSTGKVASFIESQGQQLPPGLTLPPGATKPVVLTFREEGRVRYTVMAEMSQEQVAELPQFFRSTLEPQGWTLEEEQDRVVESAVSFRRGPSRVSAMTQYEGARPRLYLTLEQQE